MFSFKSYLGYEGFLCWTAADENSYDRYDMDFEGMLHSSSAFIRNVSLARTDADFSPNVGST